MTRERFPWAAQAICVALVLAVIGGAGQHPAPADPFYTAESTR